MLARPCLASSSEIELCRARMRTALPCANKPRVMRPPNEPVAPTTRIMFASIHGVPDLGSARPASSIACRCADQPRPIAKVVGLAFRQRLHLAAPLELVVACFFLPHAQGKQAGLPGCCCHRPRLTLYGQTVEQSGVSTVRHIHSSEVTRRLCRDPYCCHRLQIGSLHTRSQPAQFQMVQFVHHRAATHLGDELLAYSNALTAATPRRLVFRTLVAAFASCDNLTPQSSVS